MRDNGGGIAVVKSENINENTIVAMLRLENPDADPDAIVAHRIAKVLSWVLGVGGG
jgi:hypothetical protein